MRPPDPVKKRESRVRWIKKELIKLDRARRNLARIPLDKPVRYGWYKGLVLRSDVAGRIDAPVFQEILDTCGRWVWGKTRKQADEQWAHMLRSRRRNWQWAGFSRVSRARYNQLSPAARKYFTEYEWRWTPWQGSQKRFYCHVPRCYFLEAYEKAYVTHLQAVDSELESQIAYLENQMVKDEFYPYSWYANRDHVNKWMRKWENRTDRHRAKKALMDYDEEKFDQLMGKSFRY